MSEITNFLLVEKYRPERVSEVIGKPRNKIINYLKEPATIPHFIFSSNIPGTGKTSMALAMINELGCDSLIMNSSDERRLEDVRDKIKIFAQSQSSKPGIKKCIFCDEFDGILGTTQNALRNIMETNSRNTFFILTCNNISKIIKPIQNRCILIEFGEPDKLEIFNYLKKICELEKIKYEETAIKQLIFINYPSIRNMVMRLQDAKVQDESLTLDNIAKKEKFENYYQLLKTKNLEELKKLIYTGTLDVQEFNNWLFRKAIKDATTENFNKLTILTGILAENEKSFVQGVNLNIVFLASCIEIINKNLL